MIYHDIPSNENIPSYHIPIVISIYPINICIYIYMNIPLCPFSPIIYPLYIHIFGTRCMSAHTDRLLRLMVENGVTNTAVLERLNAVRWGAVAESWKISPADMGFFSSNRRFLPTTHHSKMYEPKNCVPNLS